MIGIIAAYANSHVIGYKGHIPWNIPGEQKLFRELTTGNIVIMGRKTYEDIGSPLPDRINIIVSRSMPYSILNEEKYDNLHIARSFDEALELAYGMDEVLGKAQESLQTSDCCKNIYIAGGETIYRQALDIVDVMYITEVYANVNGDAFFPGFDRNEFRIIREEYHDGDIPYKYITYIRR
jgi:dihydrofolate reductase